jgi:hypothetical protein
MTDSEDIPDGWPKRGGPGYIGVVLVSLLVSALVVGGAPLGRTRSPGRRRLLGTADRDADRATVEVPSVTRIPLEAADELLTARGLKLLSTGSTSDAEVSPGWVVTQSPAGGAKLRRGRAVRVTLSGGPPLVPVPAAVVGTGLLEAQQLLVQAGLRVGSVEATGATLRVTATRPAPGEQAATGAPVTLVVEVVPPAGADAGTEETPARRRR